MRLNVTSSLSLLEACIRPVYERFLARTDRSGPCWIWTGHVGTDGYGEFVINKVRLRAHRASYELWKGAIPNELIVCHSCDKPRCVNPDHLWLGTNRENQQDKARKRRGAEGLANGKYTCPASRLFGEMNPAAKLVAEQVQRIRDEYASGGIAQAELARKYHVSHALISFIITRKVWTHLKDAHYPTIPLDGDTW